MTDTYILVAEVSGDQPLHGKLGSVETQRAVERCRNRAERAIEAYLGKHIKAEGRQLIAHFPRGENAALAAFDMRDRVRQLPPVSGVALAINIAVHARTTEDPADDVAQSLARVCPSGQILVSEEAAEGFPPNIREQLGTADLDAPPDLYPQPLYVFRTGATLAGTMAKAGEPATAPAASTSPAPAARSDAETVARPVGMRGSLMLRHNKNNLSVSDRQPVVLAGREEGNDLVIADRRASRHHACIEWRQNHFILIDTSTNGTYMVDDEGHEVVLRRGETDLPKRGRIGFGYSPTEVGAEVVFFDLGHR